jgi:broad specificity phosphatase PhoE
MKKIILVRHAETEWTVEGRHTGLTDIPLSEKGEIQAKGLKKRLQSLHPQKIFVSPLKRAIGTCKLAGLFDKATIDPDLVEWDYGNYEGLTTEEITAKDPTWTIFTKGAPGGESVADVCQRADRVLKKLELFSGGVVLFSSAHFSRLLTARWLQLPPSEGRLFILYPASISVLGFERENHVIVSWNEIRHVWD